MMHNRIRAALGAVVTSGLVLGMGLVSASSASATVTSPAAQNVTLTRTSDTTMQVTWDAPSGATPWAYQIQLDRKPICSLKLDNSTVNIANDWQRASAPNSDTITVNVSPNEVFTAQVEALYGDDANGTTSASAEVSSNVLSYAPDSSNAPLAPSYASLNEDTFGGKVGIAVTMADPRNPDDGFPQNDYGQETSNSCPILAYRYTLTWPSGSESYTSRTPNGSHAFVGLPSVSGYKASVAVETLVGWSAETAAQESVNLRVPSTMKPLWIVRNSLRPIVGWHKTSANGGAPLSQYQIAYFERAKNGRWVEQGTPNYWQADKSPRYLFFAGLQCEERTVHYRFHIRAINKLGLAGPWSGWTYYNYRWATNKPLPGNNH